MQRIKNFLQDSPASRLALLIASYTAIAIVMTYPLITHFRSFYAADSEDGIMSVWSIWWMKFSLLDLHQNPLQSNYLFYPDGVSLVYHSMPKALGLISIPFQYVMGLTGAYNFIFMSTFVGTGLATYWLIYQLLKERLPAFLAGAIYAFSSFRWGQSNHLTLLSTMSIPVFIALLIKGHRAYEQADKRGWLYFVFAGTTAGAAAYDNEQYAIFLLIFSAVYVLCYLPLKLDREKFNNWFKLLYSTGLAFAVAAVLYSPVFIAARNELSKHGDYVTFPLGTIWPGADLLSFFVPQGSSTYLGQHFAYLSKDFPAAEAGYLGLFALVLAMSGIWFCRDKRQKWLWVTSTVLFVVLALGPYITVSGEVKNLKGPYIIISKIPLLNAVRAPGRFVLIAMLAVAVLAGFGISGINGLLKKLKWANIAVPAFAAIILLAIFLEYRPSPQLFSAKIPPVYEKIAADNRAGSVVEIPLGWEIGLIRTGMEKTYTELYQTVHRKTLVSGMVARAPKERAISGMYTPALDYLANPVGFQPAGLDLDQAAVDRVMEQYGIAYIIIHKVYPLTYTNGVFTAPGTGIDAATAGRIGQYATTYLKMEKFEETDELVAYRRKP